MFGYLTAATELLEEEQLKRYKSAYCGLCRSLRDRHGNLARMTLTYDITFLVLLLDSLYEPEERTGENTCLVHPRTARPWRRSEFTDYGADMNLALAYLKCMDDWEDDSSPLALAEAKTLQKAYRNVCARYPRQCGAIERSLKQLHTLERERIEDPDAAAGSFGELMAEVLVVREDRWADTLRCMGRALGRFLYTMDACMDLDADALRGRYNPYRRWYGLDNSRRFRDILKMLLGECLFYYDRLPLVQDASLLQNILCAGLWAQYDKKFEPEKGRTHGTGSV